MAYSLAAYGTNAFQEFILPQTDNADFHITLSSAIYGFAEDVTLSFEIVDGIWRFVSCSENAVIRKTSLEPGSKLEVGSLILLKQGEVRVSVLVMELDQNLTRFQKYHIERPCQLQIGASEGCHIVYDFQGLISRTHAMLTVGAGGCRIQDTSRNGIYMDGQRIHGERALAFGEVVNIFGLQIIWLGSVLAVGTIGHPMKVHAAELRQINSSAALYPNGVHQLEGSSVHLFHRSPRVLPKLHTDEIEIEAVPQPARTNQRPLLLQVGPAMTMVIPMLLGTMVALFATSATGGKPSPYMYTGIIIAVASGLLGVMWALINMRYAKKEAREAEENRVRRYQIYLQETEQDIYTKAEENRHILENAYPSAEEVTTYNAYCPALWNRNQSHQDMLYVRLGQGDMPFQCPIRIPKKTFTLYDDALAAQPKLISERYRVLHNVPVGIDLRKKNLIGVVADGKSRTASGIMRVMAAQIAANTCYTDVKLVFIGSEKRLSSGGSWGFCRWLPHVWSESRVTRFCASTPAEITEVCLELSEVIRTRTEGMQSKSDEDTYPSPHYVIFIEDLTALQNESIVKHLLAPEQRFGITTVILAASREHLPNACEDVIESKGSRGSIYNLSEGAADGTELTFDRVSRSAMENFARRISNVEVSEVVNGGDIPETLTFLDMWGVKTIPELNVLERWRKNRTYDTMRGLIGQKAGGRDCYLDIHEKHHGPHGLVAGTTGSGKSETMQTYILSMAMCYSPNDIAFFVIDYKGGGMANLFSNLPHLSGQISNLSGNQVHRAMVSIKSENRRRQRLFNECGVNHIDNYTRLYKSGETSIPIPHLLIIIDEFAELKKEEGSFMRELISVAQVGRSLGVHLILATQKPEGTVDDNIRCNAKFRICLRVQDRQDSNEMLHRPDAAYITRAGRAFMQVGNDEVFEEFQSGWSGADYDETLADGNTKIAIMRTLTGKPAITGNHLKKQQKDHKRMLWLQSLVRMLHRQADQMQGSFAAIASDRAQLAVLVDRTMAELEREHIDYGRSHANEDQLMKFAAAFAEFDDQDWRQERVMLSIEDALQKRGIKLPELKGKTQLSAMVDYLSALAAENGYTNTFRLWLPVLPECLGLRDLEGYEHGCFDGAWADDTKNWTLQAMVGKSDNPANQIQFPYVINFHENGNLAVCGAAGSGKSTFLQTLLFSLSEHYSPAWLNYYILDFSNKSLAPFADAPHCGGVVFDDDPERTSKLFHMLETIIRERKTLLRGTSYSQYVQRNGTKVPAVLLVIDNYASFKEKTGGAWEPTLLTLSREGNNYGVYLAITAGGFGGSEIPNRIADNLRSTACLEMGDKFKYGEVLRNIHFDVMPEAGVKGRGIASIQGSILEYQTALAVNEPDDYKRTTALSAAFARMRAAWTGKPARRIPEIPAKPVIRDLTELDEYRAAIEDPRTMPIAYRLEDASVFSLDLPTGYCWLITGKARTGKTNLLQVFLAGAQAKQAKTVVIDFSAAGLEKAAKDAGADYVCDSAGMRDFSHWLQQEFLRRNRLKRDWLAEGLDEDELFERMSKEQPIWILVDDLGDLMQEIYHSKEPFGAPPFYENILEKGRLHNIYFAACVNTEKMAMLSGRTAYERMAAARTGIHLGGVTTSQNVLDFSAMPFQEQSKALKPGVGLIPADLDHPAVQKIIIPAVKR